MIRRDGHLAMLAAVLLLAALVGGALSYVSVTLADIEQGLPRRSELLDREIGKLNRDVAVLDEALGAAAALATAPAVENTRQKSTFLMARLDAVDALSRAVHGDADPLGLAGLRALVTPVAAALSGLDGAPGAALPAETGAVLARARAAFRPALDRMEVAHTRAGNATAEAIRLQGDRLADFRRIAQGMLVIGGLSLLLALVLMVRARATALALRRSTDRYHQLFDANAVVMLLVDPATGTVVDGNRAAVAFYGWPQAALRGKPLTEINTLSEGALFRTLERVTREGHAAPMLMTHYRADGTRRQVEVRCGPVTVDGRDLLLAGIHDVSDRDEARRALAETENRYRMVIDSTTQGFWLVESGTGVTLDVNDSLCRMLGHARADIIGRPITDFARDDDRALLAGKVESALHTRHRSYEVTLTRCDGARVLTRFDATTLRGFDGGPRGSFAFIEDITAQRAFEERLEKSEAMLRSITANVPGVIFQWRERRGGGRGFSWVSPRSTEILGVSHVMLEADWTRLRIHDDDRPAFHAGLRRAVDSGTDWSFEGRVHRPGGGLVWLRGVARPATGAGTADETVLNGIFLDITPQKDLEAALDENRGLLNLALEAGRIGVWDLDLATSAVWYSDQWKAQLGYRPEELENTVETWRRLIDPADRETAWALVEAFASGQAPVFDLMQRYRHADGSTVHVRSRARVVCDGAGRPARLIGAHVDLTPQIEAQENLARLNVRNNLILDSTADGLFGIDDAGRITFVNSACRRLLGFTEAEMIGAESHALTHHSRPDGSPYPSESCPVHAVVREGTTRELVDEVLWRRDGTALPVELSAAPMIRDGRRLGAIVSFRDVSERMAWKAELERSNAELEQFAYAASHDMQEPLRAVTSFLGLLKRRHGPSLEPGAARYVDEAMTSAQRMTGMIRDLLTYSRVRSRGREPEPVALAACLEAALANLRIALAEADATVKVDGPLPWVSADPSQLVSLLQNLIGNAVKYRAPDRPPNIRVTVESPDPPGAGGGPARWRVSVADNGIGIPPEFRERIFLPFQRLHTHDDVPGTGIGLAVCRKVVERHGGRLDVIDRPDGTPGAVFRFDLAAASAPPAPAPAEADQAAEDTEVPADS